MWPNLQQVLGPVAGPEIKQLGGFCFHRGRTDLASAQRIAPASGRIEQICVFAARNSLFPRGGKQQPNLVTGHTVDK